MPMIHRVLNYPLVLVGETPLTAISLLTILVVFIVGILLSTFLQRTIRSQFKDRLSFEKGAGYAILRVGHYFILALSLLIALQTAGFNLSGLTVIGGFLGVGVGFGLQNVTSNFISGIILLFEQPIRVGDRVSIHDHIGTVKRIGIRSTTVQTFDNVVVILPNSMFVQERVINWSHGDPKIRIHVPFGVAYGSDVPRVRETVLGVCHNYPQTLNDPPPEVRFLEFGDSSLNFELLAWINDPKGQLKISSDLYYGLEAAFRENKIEIPFPQRDVHIRTTVGPSGGSSL